VTHDACMVIGIAGGSGSGKTTIAEALANDLGPDNVALILHDSYYRDLCDLSMAEREAVNYDHPESLETDLLVSHVEALLAGEAFDKPIYDFTVHNRRHETEHVEPRPVILVEGVLALVEKPLRALMNLKIFVDTDADIRFMRRLERDIDERGRTRESVFEQYLRTVKPMHDRYVEPSKAWADLVIPEGYNIGAVGTVRGMLRDFLRHDD